MEIAARYLATRPRTRWELEQRLRRAGAGDDVVEATLSRLAHLGYVDDVAFVRYWQEQRVRHAPRGRRLIEAELRRRGVGRDTFATLDEDLGRSDDEPLPETEAERARIALARHLRGRPMPVERRALQRLGAFLMRRGFDPETVRTTLRGAGAEALTESEEAIDRGDQ
jgi:regulatory protein